MLVRAPCIVDPVGRPDIQILDAKGAKVAMFTAPRTAYDAVDITLEVGVGAATTKGCAEGSQKLFRVTDGRSPAVAPEITGKAWTILLTAFVIALLLEQAFALLFNWRLFLELAVGKAWRTPIMFFAAYLLCHRIDMDLIRDLANAYDVKHVHVSDTLTRALTAAILAGGSVGVNHILTGLGFRSQIRADIGAKPLDVTQAWVAVHILGPCNGVRICIDEADPGITGISTYAGTVGAMPLYSRLKDLFFPNSARFPRAGGYLVSTTKVYQIYALTSGGRRLGPGGDLTTVGALTQCRFAPRAIVDLYISITPSMGAAS